MLVQIWLAWSAICCVVFNLLWWGSKNARTPNAELDKQYPWFRNIGEDKWNYWTMLLQSFTLFPFRFALNLLGFIICFLVHVAIGEVDDDSWARRKLSCVTQYIAMGWFQFIACGFYLQKRDVDFDYSKWLGPTWRQQLAEFRRSKHVSTYIPSHTGILDVSAMLVATYQAVAFVAGAHLKKVPPINRGILAGDGIYVERGADRQETANKLDEITTRQRAIENGECDRKPLVIFAEGLCTNNTGIAKFKRGGFQSLCAVTPTIIQQKYSTVFVGLYSCLDHVTMLLSMCTLTPSKYVVQFMPPFVPNEYMYSQKSHLPKWEAYAESVREAMLEQSKMKACDATFSEVKDYIKTMQKGCWQAPWARNFKSPKDKQ